MTDLYPPLEPYATHSITVGGGHQLYVEECGNPQGLPVVFLHGGPGGGCKPYQRAFFHPEKYRAILFDQRGAGRSKPVGLLEHNTTADLLADMETIREKLGIQQWLLFGGSWGATLSLLYAQAFPARVSGIVLRGSFLARQRDLDWYIKDGVNRIYPEFWAEFLSVLKEADRADVISAMYRILHGEDELAQRRVARAWSVWGGKVALGEAYRPADPEGHVAASQLQQAKIELHYGYHRYFIEENQILKNSHLVPKVPTLIIHGRQDLVCPVESAYQLQQHLPHAELKILPKGGHVASGVDMSSALVEAADAMVTRLAR